MSNRYWEQLASVVNKPVLSISLYDAYLSDMAGTVENSRIDRRCGYCIEV